MSTAKFFCCLSILLASFSFASGQNDFFSDMNETTKAGFEIYKTQCIGCHGKFGDRIVFGTTKKIADMEKKEFIKALRGYKNKTRNVYGFSRLMTANIIDLNDKDFENIYDYIEYAKGKKKEKEKKSE